MDVNGMSASSVAISLNKQGISGKRGGEWQGNAVSRTIQNTFHLERKKISISSKLGHTLLA